MTSFFATYLTEQATTEAALPAQREALLSALRAAGITEVRADISGSGDSGGVAYIDSEPCRLPEPLRDILETYIYAALHVYAAGWENSDGGQGEFVFNAEHPEGHLWLDFNVPHNHAQSSARKFGGIPQDYQAIHDWFDASQAFIADFRHRAHRHHAEGIFACEHEFGTTVTNSNNVQVPVRLIGEQHIREDLGRIPSLADWLLMIHPQPWMMRGHPNPGDPNV